MEGFSVRVYPGLQEFNISSGGTTLESRMYSNSSNTYRGARSAVRNLLRNKNVTNESNYGNECLTITNNNGFVLAAKEYGTSSTAKRNVKTLLDKTSNIKPNKVELEVIS